MEEYYINHWFNFWFIIGNSSAKGAILGFYELVSHFQTTSGNVLLAIGSSTQISIKKIFNYESTDHQLDIQLLQNVEHIIYCRPSGFTLPRLIDNFFEVFNFIFDVFNDLEWLQLEGMETKNIGIQSGYIL